MPSLATRTHPSASFGNPNAIRPNDVVSTVSNAGSFLAYHPGNQVLTILIMSHAIALPRSGPVDYFAASSPVVEEISKRGGRFICFPNEKATVLESILPWLTAVEKVAERMKAVHQSLSEPPAAPKPPPPLGQDSEARPMPSVGVPGPPQAKPNRNLKSPPETPKQPPKALASTPTKAHAEQEKEPVTPTRQKQPPESGHKAPTSPSGSIASYVEATPEKAPTVKLSEAYLQSSEREKIPDDLLKKIFIPPPPKPAAKETVQIHIPPFPTSRTGPPPVPASPATRSVLGLTAEEIAKAIPANASAVFHIFDRRICLESFSESATVYELLRAWVQDDPFRVIPPVGVDPADYASAGNDSDLAEVEKPVVITDKVSADPSTDELRKALVRRGKLIKRRKQLAYRQQDAAVLASLQTRGIKLA